MYMYIHTINVEGLCRLVKKVETIEYTIDHCSNILRECKQTRRNG